jgi:hypothetical protein
MTDRHLTDIYWKMDKWPTRTIDRQSKFLGEVTTDRHTFWPTIRLRRSNVTSRFKAMVGQTMHPVSALNSEGLYEGIVSVFQWQVRHLMDYQWHSWICEQSKPIQRSLALPRFESNWSQVRRNICSVFNFNFNAVACKASGLAMIR